MLPGVIVGPEKKTLREVTLAKEITKECLGWIKEGTSQGDH